MFLMLVTDNIFRVLCPLKSARSGVATFIDIFHILLLVSNSNKKFVTIPMSQVNLYF